MAFLKSVSQRNRQPELMDQPDLDADQHVQALRGLERVNWWSGSASILWSALRPLAQQVSPRRLRILDVASGAGDVPIRLWQKAQRAGLPIDISGSDCNVSAVTYASRRAQDAAVPVQFQRLDVLNENLPADYDVLTNSLFLHHLDPPEASLFLQRAAQVAGRMLMINDLIRSPAGFLLAYLGTRILSRCPVVHIDGPRSVQGAFTVAEACALAQQAGLEGVRVMPRWPCRYLLTWTRCPS